MITDIVMMPGKDYKDICDAIRSATGETGLLRSGDIVRLTNPELVMDADLMAQGGVYPKGSVFVRTVVIPEDATYLDLETFVKMPFVETIYYYGQCEIELLNEYDSSSKSYSYYNAFTNGDIAPKKMIVGGAVKNVDAYFANKSASLEEVVLEEGVETIGANSFSYCSSISKLTLPNGLKSIGYYAFYCALGLTDLELPSTVESIGNDAFAGYSSPGGVTQMNITNVKLNQGLKTIGSYAFAYGGMNSITIPDSVVSIGGAAFYGCYALESITILGMDTTITGSSLAPSFTTIRGYAGSYAETYASENGYTFEVIE